MDDVISEVAEMLGEAALEELPEFEPFILPLNEYLSRCLDVFSDTLGVILHTPILRFFAVVGLVCVAVGLCRYLISTGRQLSC